jgi:hypothetical protein
MFSQNQNVVTISKFIENVRVHIYDSKLVTFSFIMQYNFIIYLFGVIIVDIYFSL